MQALEPILAEHPFCAGMREEHLALLAGCAANVRFAAGETIFHEGDRADRFYLLRGGRAAIEIHVPGRGPATIQTLGEGEVLGWSWLVEPYAWRFDARAVEATRAVALDGQCLRGKCDADPALGYELLKRLAQVMTERLQATRIQLLDLYGVRP